MASIDPQTYSPLLEKKNFRDLLKDDLSELAEEDVITKIFSQSVQISPSDETADLLVGSTIAGHENGSSTTTEGARSNEDEEEEDEDDDEARFLGRRIIETDLDEVIDKVPADFTHFNRTIVDLDEVDEGVVQAATDDDDVAEGDPNLVDQCNPLIHVDTPSTATPVDEDEQSEIRDFEEIERITLSEDTEIGGKGDDDEEEEEEDVEVDDDTVDQEAIEICEELTDLEQSIKSAAAAAATVVVEREMQICNEFEPQLEEEVEPHDFQPSDPQSGRVKRHSDDDDDYENRQPDEDDVSILLLNTFCVCVGG